PRCWLSAHRPSASARRGDATSTHATIPVAWWTTYETSISASWLCAAELSRASASPLEHAAERGATRAGHWRRGLHRFAPGRTPHRGWPECNRPGCHLDWPQYQYRIRSVSDR